MKNLILCLITASRSLTILPAGLRAATKTFALFIVLTSVIWIVPQKASAQRQVDISFQVFYDNLSPYGNWVDNSDYGYVWIPRVSYGFTPYGTNGYWVFTNEGWTWVSNYSWGWAPFHYGRWFYDSYYGWVWVPDNEWGPGWVTWRRSEGYYGWAPIGPGVSFDVAYSNGYNLPYDRWRFVKDRDFGRRDINNYYVSSSNYTKIINNSTVINNIQQDNSRNVRYNAGPDRSDVEKRVGKTFTPIVIKESSRPAQSLKKNQLEIYRPQVQKNITAERRPAPAKVVGWKGSHEANQDQPHNDQQIKLKEQQQRNDQQAKEKQQQRNDQQVKLKEQQQRNNQQAKEQQQQRNDQQAKQKQQQHNDQQVKQKEQQQKRNDQQAKQKQQQHNDQQVKQKQQQKQNDQQVRKEEQQRNGQQVKEQPAKQKQSQPQKTTDQKK